MKFPVRPLAPSSNRPDFTYKSGKVVQISGASSLRPGEPPRDPDVPRHRRDLHADLRRQRQSCAEAGRGERHDMYTWDSRNRLTQITSPTTTATFQYDGLGRRVARTVNGRTTQYVYDGPQAIGEITNGQPVALLTGLQIDEVIARYTSAGTRTYLTDALGSVIAQTNDEQAVQNFYGYTPYGETQALGPDEGNAIQYTARENDQTGLYYYRARYYDPVLKRFVSEDPIGMAGGTHFYAYVRGNPINYRDPLGLKIWTRGGNEWTDVPMGDGWSPWNGPSGGQGSAGPSICASDPPPLSPPYLPPNAEPSTPNTVVAGNSPNYEACRQMCWELSKFMKTPGWWKNCVAGCKQ
jgi:RHS repeat-associated protein